jgi:hypothetical protein
MEIQEIDDVFLAFPANVSHLMPRYEDIPEEFKSSSNKWCGIASRWFFKGLPKTTVFKPKEGVDTNKALRHLGAIQGSFEPKHEHKEAAVAYLMSQWFDNIEVPK